MENRAKGEHVVRSILKTKFRGPIEDIVQLRSRVQAQGNLVFTKALLLAAESGSIPDEMASQSFVGACQRAVCTKPTQARPSEVKYTHKPCEVILRQAQDFVISKISSFSDCSGLTETFNQAAREYVTVLSNNAWMNFANWQQKLIYWWLLEDGVHKSCHSFVTKSLLQTINRAPSGPDPSRYKDDRVREQGVPYIKDQRAQKIINSFKDWMVAIPDKEEEKTNTSDWEGIACESHIKKHLAKFLYVGIKIAEEIERIRFRIADGERKPKIPQIIPQLHFKVRCVTFGVQQMTELCLLVSKTQPELTEPLLRGIELEDKYEIKLQKAKKQLEKATKQLQNAQEKLDKCRNKNTCSEKDKKALQNAETKATKAAMMKEKKQKDFDERLRMNKKRKQNEENTRSRKKRKQEDEKCAPLTREQWEALFPEVFPLIFSIPKRLKNVSSVTTDGISASWHVQDLSPKKKISGTTKPKEKENKGPRKLKAREATPGFYGQAGEDCCFVLDDSTTVIGIDPGHANVICATRQRPLSSSPPASSSALERLGLSKYVLKNTTWRDVNGNRQYHQRVQAQGKRFDIPAAAARLAECSSRSVASYDVHVTGRLETAEDFQKVMELKNRRRWKFESYQKGQRAVHKLVTDVLEGVENKRNVVVAWGDGSFGPTSKGHAPAPNKGLMCSLARFLPIVLVDEYRTTKMSCCCRAKAVEKKTARYKATGGRATVVQCGECQTLLSRDFSASTNIVKAFRHVNATNQRHNQFRILTSEQHLEGPRLADADL